ncbi:hypothetical protein AHAS_Ahas15G0239700 [Arachis hypogaea]
MVVQDYIEEGFIGIWWWLLIITRRSTRAIRLVCILEWLLLIVHLGRLLPRRLINSLRLLPSLIVPSLMYVVSTIPILYNIVVTTLSQNG